MSLLLEKAALSRWRLATCAITVALAFDASAQSNSALIENPDFVADLSGWATRISTPGGSGSITWSPTDLLGNPGSGSVVINGPRGVYSLYVCFKAERLFGIAREFRTEIVSASSGASARLITNVTTGFQGDAGETGDCVGPATDDVDGVDARLDVAGIVQHVTPPQSLEYLGPLVTFSATVHKFDDGVVMLDAIRLIPDLDLTFRESFE